MNSFRSKFTIKNMICVLKTMMKDVPLNRINRCVYVYLNRKDVPQSLIHDLWVSVIQNIVAECVK